MTKDYSNEPVSVSQHRAERENDASIWSPRDAAIDFLRRLDAGVINPTRVVICYREGEPDDPSTCYTIAGSDPIIHVGMLERVKQMLLEDLP